MTELDALPKHLEGGLLKVQTIPLLMIGNREVLLNDWPENVADSLVCNAREHIHEHQACRIDRLDDL